jgi:glycosyltransferase involved in cell wall biosynthesis
MFQLEEQTVSSEQPLARKELNGLRVLHLGKFYPPHPGGMETHLQALCGELKHVVSLEVVVAGDGRETIEETVDGVRVSRLGTLLNFAAAPVCPEMVRRLRESKADIVHLHWPNPTAVLAYLASGHRGKLVFTYHSDIIRQRLLRKPFWPVLRRALKRAHAIIATSPNYLQTSQVLQKFQERCRVIPFGISLKEFNQANTIEVSKIRKQYGSRIVLGVGRLVYYKGFEYLIRAMRDVEGHLLIVGNGPLLNALGQEAHTVGVSTRVTFLTNITDVRPFYHAADVFALPSIARSEAFGIVQLEAMACGKAIVNTSLDSGVPFVSQDGVSGLTVPPADAASLAKAINTLLDNPDLCARYGRAARLRVEQEFSLELMTQRTLQLYKDVIASSNGE